MCGIAGIVNLSGKLSPAELSSTVVAMTDKMVYRGPDDSGVWVDPTGFCALGQRRLSIIDLSPAGHQPMLSADSQAAVTFNGEIYNFQEIKADLEKEGATFRTRTDTEVLIELFKRKGAASFQKMDGMYAFAYFDQKTRELTLARDPFGEKPCYYYHRDGIFAFASEMHALAVIPGFDATIDQNAMAEYFSFQYVQAPRAFYKNVKKLEPGHFLVLSASGQVRIEKHFDFLPGRKAEYAARSMNSLADELEEILIRSLKRRVISDVPLGAFLSGGVDSSLTVALMAKVLGQKVKTFTIGFEGAQESEHHYAREMANHLGTEHFEKILKPDILSLASHIGHVLDEPNADSSCLPTYLLAQHAREHVTVCLSGDGGDELFGGYGRYFSTLQDEEKIKKAGTTGWKAGDAYFSCRILVYEKEHLEQLMGPMPAETQAYLASLRDKVSREDFPLLARLREADLKTYMPGAVLPKVDRMSMQHSLEVRTPFLTQEVARFAEKLSTEQCYADGHGKLVLKEVAARYIPMEWLTRPKMGFGLPMSIWGKEQLLPATRKLTLASDGAAQAWLGRKRITDFLARQENSFSTYQVWALLILEQWLRSHPATMEPTKSLPLMQRLFQLGRIFPAAARSGR